MAINADIQKQVYDLLSRASNLSFVSAEQEGGGRIALMPGQRVTAEVLSTLPNNRVQVQIGVSQYNLDLPMTVRPGQNLSMTFVTHDPRDTFAIARQGVPAPPVTLTDASRLMALLAENEQLGDPSQRSVLQSISNMLRQTSGDAGVLANLMDEAVTYGSTRPMADASAQTGALPQQGQAAQARFEANASQILLNIARNSRFVLAEAVNSPLTPLPLMPGQETEATVVGTLPGGRVFVQAAGADLELQMARQVKEGDTLRLTFISALPKPLFAVPRAVPPGLSGVLSEAGRWLSLLEHNSGGISGQQLYVLERLNTILKSLPPDSPVFTAIQDEAITYQTVMRGMHRQAEAEPVPQQMLRPGNGVVLSEDMARLLQALIKGNRLVLLEALNQTPASGLVPGQQIKADVLASLGGGRFLVQVGRQVMEFSMPKGTHKGDRLNLFFVSEEQGAIFLMARFGRPGDARVSDTSRWLTDFLGGTSGRMQAQEAFGLLKALLADPPMNSAEVMAGLQKGMRESGLFYESHLARWFGGDYPLEDLLREPQGRMTIINQLGLANFSKGEGEEGALSIVQRGLLAEPFEAALKKAAHITDTEVTLDKRLQSIVRDQLETLQSGQIMLRGELYPGQSLQWTVAERESGRNSTGEQERTWDTSLSLKLPRLGDIDARLSLDGQQLQVNIRAADAAAAGELEAGRQMLSDQLEAAGLTPGSIRISHEAE